MSSSELAPPAAPSPPDGAAVRTFAFAQLERRAEIPPGGAADILSAAWAEAERVRERARREGEAAGRTEGLAAASAESAGAVAALGSAIRALAELREELIAAVERQAAELALRLAEQIVAAAIAVEPERVVDVTRSALRRLTDRHQVTVLVNPSDLELLSAAAEPLGQELGGIDHFAVQADRRIARGGAMVRTDYGELDMSVGAQLQTARELIETALRGDDPDAGELDDAT